jgi:LPS-assembly lipoprotein
MSSTKHPRHRRCARGIVAAGAAAWLFAATGCGLQPIHGQRSAANSEALATVDIRLISDRRGQMLRNELLQQMQPRGARIPAQYSLSVGLKEAIQNLGIRKDETATRANLTMTAKFTVTQLSGRKMIRTGETKSVNSYNILTSDFATLSARKDARRRAIRQLATDIKERVSVWLIRSGGSAPPGR